MWVIVVKCQFFLQVNEQFSHSVVPLGRSNMCLQSQSCASLFRISKIKSSHTLVKLHNKFPLPILFHWVYRKQSGEKLKWKMEQIWDFCFTRKWVATMWNGSFVFAVVFQGAPRQANSGCFLGTEADGTRSILLPWTPGMSMLFFKPMAELGGQDGTKDAKMPRSSLF